MPKRRFQPNRRKRGKVYGLREGMNTKDVVLARSSPWQLLRLTAADVPTRTPLSISSDLYHPDPKLTGGAEDSVRELTVVYNWQSEWAPRNDPPGIEHQGTR